MALHYHFPLPSPRCASAAESTTSAAESTSAKTAPAAQQSPAAEQTLGMTGSKLERKQGKNNHCKY